MDIFQGRSAPTPRSIGADNYKNKKAVADRLENNSAHDIVQRFGEAGARDRTMVQRSTTNVVKSGLVLELGVARLYSEQAVQSGMTSPRPNLICACAALTQIMMIPDPVYTRDQGTRVPILTKRSRRQLSWRSAY